MNTDDFIDGLRQKDPVAAKHLHECLVPSIWRFVYFRVNRNSHLAEDIVSETVLAFVDAVAGEVEVEHPAAWLRTVASRRVNDHYRAVARVQHLLQDGEQHTKQVDEQDPSKAHDKELKRATVREAMDELPDDYRAALEWKYVDKLDVRSIAQRLGATEKAAESILFRARKTLRARLSKEFPEVDAKKKSARSTKTPINDEPKAIRTRADGSRTTLSSDRGQPPDNTVRDLNDSTGTPYLGIQFTEGT